MSMVLVKEAPTTIIVHDARCPKCNSLKIKIHTTVRSTEIVRTRYYRCACGHHFKAIVC